MISRAMEDYLKAIYQASQEGEMVSTSELAERMNCSAASATNMIQKLSQMKLVSYKPYQGVKMTDAGAKVALETIRHHRLIELYLAEVLGYTWDKVHDEAEKLEHVISEEFEDKIDEALGFPTRDPHGDPIPRKDGTVEDVRFDSLWEVSAGQTVEVRRVSDRDSDVLRYLASIGVYPDVQLEVMDKAPFNGPVNIKVEGKVHGLSEQLARQIFVSPLA
ncbi:MAG TPA: metal-dependent transcriptional regulator [Acidobacteriota bacterium]|nr:metal-dependent transcriptional regulator [Acidobacteriota bacterium]